MNTASAKPVGLLARLAPADLQALVDCASVVPFQHDQEVLRQGERNGSLFIVQEGLLHVRRQVTKKRDVLLGRLEPGSFFGEVSLFDPGPTTAAVRAVSSGVLLEIRREHLADFVARSPAGGATLLLGLLEEMATRLRDADQRFADSVVWGALKS